MMHGMDECVRDIDTYLEKLDELRLEACAILVEIKLAELRGEREACGSLDRQWRQIRVAERMLNEQLDHYIMFRLPPAAMLRR